MNTYLFDPTKDKYYAMFLMNMDAKEYTISNYLYQMIKSVDRFLPFTCFYGMSVGLPLWIMILCPIFVMMVKTFINSLSLIDFKRTKKVKNENLPTSVVWILLLVLLVCAYALPYISIVIPTWLFLIFFVLSLGLGIFGFYQIFHFRYYRFLYKQLLTNAPLVIDQTSIRRDASLSQIELDTSLNSTKEGFSYFHELFVKRHRKIFNESHKETDYRLSWNCHCDELFGQGKCFCCIYNQSFDVGVFTVFRFYHVYAEPWDNTYASDVYEL